MTGVMAVRKPARSSSGSRRTHSECGRQTSRRMDCGWCSRAIPIPASLDIYIMRMNGAEMTPLVVDESANDFDPAWQPVP